MSADMAFAVSSNKKKIARGRITVPDPARELRFQGAVDAAGPAIDRRQRDPEFPPRPCRLVRHVCRGRLRVRYCFEDPLDAEIFCARFEPSTSSSPGDRPAGSLLRRYAATTAIW
jgi:hypothetical protein